MVTATTAPVRPKHSRFTVVRVGPFEGNQMTITLRIDDETGAPVGEVDLFSTASQRTGLAYTASGGVVATAPVSSSAAFLSADFAAFADAPGGFGAKAAALEERLQSTGRIPA